MLAFVAAKCLNPKLKQLFFSLSLSLSLLFLQFVILFRPLPPFLNKFLISLFLEWNYCILPNLKFSLSLLYGINKTYNEALELRCFQDISLSLYLKRFLHVYKQNIIVSLSLSLSLSLSFFFFLLQFSLMF